MKISKEKLKKIIKEEMQNIYEQSPMPDVSPAGSEKVNTTQKLSVAFKELYNKFATASNNPDVNYSSREIEEFIKLINLADALISGKEDKTTALASLNQKLESLSS